MELKNEMENYTSFYNYIQHCFESPDYKKFVEETLFSIFKQNNLLVFDYKVLTSIKIVKDANYVFINGYYRENNNNTHRNTVMFLQCDTNYTIFQDHDKSLRDTILGNGFIRKLKIKKFDESIN